MIYFSTDDKKMNRLVKVKLFQSTDVFAELHL